MRLFDHERHDGYLAAWKQLAERVKGDAEIVPPRVVYGHPDPAKVTISRVFGRVKQWRTR